MRGSYFSAATIFLQKTLFLLYFCPETYGRLCVGCFLILCHYYIFAKTPFVTVLLSRNKSTKSSPLKRRDGSGKRQQTTNCQILMPAFFFYAIYAAYIKICITVLNIFYCSCPPLTSLLRRGGLPLTLFVRHRLSAYIRSFP